MLININDQGSEPLYLQIVRQVSAQIITGSLPQGEPLPSIRELARREHISVITVQKAYEELARQNLIVSRRSKGFFVADLTKTSKADLARAHCKESLEKPVRDSLSEGLDLDDIVQIVKEIVGEAQQSPQAKEEETD
ncbi:MAG TPA: GntR family transcriptional regulator [Oligoflexus sp.]|uniref:GntR family transcriptional regulator n=1 Tax=Oligoflexus sp. TaxID=1971216 RepID=UPI002D57CC38|nr:GntR family transcriptional regulator [Oligoflexus sp.]HYX36000.1 GntR family transcriptional regulator [Oligoflexus sp.]